MKNKEWIIQGIIFFGVIFLIMYMIIYLGQKTQEEIIFYCYNHNWEGNITGELYVSCVDVYNTYFNDNQWTHLCSAFPFSPKPSCHTLCNIDCEIKNKENKENFCVC